MNSQTITTLGLVLAGLALALATSHAFGHVPFLEEADYSEAKPYVVHDVTNSKSIHAQIAKPGDVDVYRIDVAQPTRIFTKTSVPFCPQYEGFAVTYALAGPGLPRPATPLPLPLPAGHGAIVVRTPVERESWVEPISGRKSWFGAEYALDEAPAGTYEMIVWNEKGETGDYIAVIGEAEIFNAPERRQVAETSPKLRNGRNLMVDCDPTVGEPVRAPMGAAAGAGR
jgi:hypothetical protein